MNSLTDSRKNCCLVFCLYILLFPHVVCQVYYLFVTDTTKKLTKNISYTTKKMATISFCCKGNAFVFLCFEFFCCFFFIFSAFSIDKLVKMHYHIYCINMIVGFLWRVDMKNTKIRMIFCDVDGTLLLNGDKIISKKVFGAINLAISNNLNICIASGRSYPDLRKLFSPVAKNVTFICNDGALVVENNSITSSSPLNKSQVACMSKTYSQEYSAMVIYAKDYTYYLSDKDFTAFGSKITYDDVSQIPGDVYKVAFYKLTQKAKIKLNNLGIKSGILNKVYEDPVWTEYIKAGTDKGTAAESVQKRYDISISETAAFGDNLNDLGMLRRARITFAANNAHAEVVRMCKFKVNNVTNEILNIIEKGDRYE